MRSKLFLGVALAAVATAAWLYAGNAKPTSGLKKAATDDCCTNPAATSTTAAAPVAIPAKK